MKKNEVNLLYSYLLNNRVYLYDDYLFYLNRIKRTNFDLMELNECLIAKQKYENFLEFSKNVVDLLKLEREKND